MGDQSGRTLSPLRRVQQARAWVGGYFWLPCPVCREPFGGHEWRDVNGLPSSVPDIDQPGLLHGICPRCTASGYGYDLTTPARVQSS